MHHPLRIHEFVRQIKRGSSRFDIEYVYYIPSLLRKRDAPVPRKLVWLRDPRRLSMLWFDECSRKECTA